MPESLPILKGRGAAHDPPNRFVRLHVLQDADAMDQNPDVAASNPATVYLKDTSRSIIAHNDSPDVGFEYSINPYRGCEHGCCYCYARPTHEYLGFSAGLDFETRILVKEQAPELLRQELMKPGWKPTTVSMCGVTDAYQPIERKLQLARRCLQVLAEFRNPVGIVTKNALVARDIDVLSELASHSAAAVFISVTTLDKDLSAKMEPRASSPRDRLEAIAKLSAAKIPVGVLVAPIVPGLTDHEMASILSAAAEAGAVSAGFVPLRLPGAVAELFIDWLHRHFPDRKEKVLNRVREIRGGKLNDPNFGSRMRGSGVFAEQIGAMFDLAKRKAGFKSGAIRLSTKAFRRPLAEGEQLSLFEHS